MPTYYFAYGTNKDKEMIKAITGKTFEGKPGYIEGYELCIQDINNVPKKAQKVLRRVWGDSFKSYAIRKGKGKVYGVIWKITPKDRQHIANWELGPEGWYKNVDVIVVLEDGSKVKAVTDIIENQKVDKIVDGKNYEPYIEDPKKMIELAKRVRK